MEVKVLHKEDDKAVLLLKDIDNVMANTLRRLIIEEVPTLAIEDVTFQKNSSALYDEMIALRLGLMPLKTDLKSYNLPDKCKCKGEGCARCQLNMSLSAKGPEMIYSKEIKSQDPKVKPVHNDIPIIELLKNQKVELEAVATLGRGKDHSKWSPGLVYYRYYPVLDTKNVKDVEKAKGVCPNDVFEVKNGKLVIKDVVKCDLNGACEEFGVKVDSKKDEIIFFVESWGQLKIGEMLTEALNILNEKLDELDSQIK